MHVALVLGPDRLAADGSSVQRLAVALAAEGIRVLRILPPTEGPIALAPLIPAMTFDFASSPLFRPSRLGALSAALEESRPEVFVAFGHRALAAAAELAEDLDAGLVAVASTREDLDAMPLAAHSERLDLLCVPTAPLAVRAARTVGDRMVRVLPVGVPLPHARDRTDPSPQSLAVAGTGRDDGAYRAVFAAIADLMPLLPDLQVAIELPAGHDPKLWRLAREMGVQRVLNGVSRLESIRPLALACGAFALPEPEHGARPIVLEAMALGRAVVAMDDPFADHLMDGVTALVARDRNAREWGGLLRRVLLDPAEARSLGAEASARVAARFGSARCAQQLGDACEAIVRGPALPFPPRGAPPG